ncbi:pentatricopeptide repeat-containing protein At1g06270 [Carica papaya]|uniref:pentatricopeptide repeat-containing protein At1g06270 n=1 Tax=Carica papaya TaxID=3649 RepID=UPI000B8C7BB5|nr:pentatricopeptide repeat-containing protein At1g06270 [Carica papaya]XP_021887142.1 pentatricopeptide repeat-containing protein At1g06270 [Carica papaya]XP_021887143.1 pentatricopeptide repeat-containing protein At1g06270 [Carica papaya]XP_021887144.1 pentatricopeptide repeat-containing protein At1g06270 [Carica papaya]
MRSEMSVAPGSTKLPKFSSFLLPLNRVCSISSPAFHAVEETIRAAVESKNYEQIPDLLILSKQSSQRNNPFLFLSNFSQIRRTQIIDDMLQAFLPLRPRSRPLIAYSYLLSHTLQAPSPLPLSLAILQCILRSGSRPALQTHLFLSSAWLHRRRQSHSVSNILLEMKSIRYFPDSTTCNYIISSLCGVDQLPEAVKVLKGMAAAGCIPDVESYGTVIAAMCSGRKTADAVDMVKQMVVKVGLVPSQGTVVKMVAALRANREIRQAVEVIDLLEREGYSVEFESYELTIEGCLECREFILAGKMAIEMTDRGFIPYIKVRQKVVEGLASIGEWKLACAVRQRFAELRS